MALILPVSAAGARRVQVRLGDDLLTIRTYYQPHTPIWRMDLSDVNDNVLVLGVPLVPGINLIRGETETTRRYGEFWYNPEQGVGNESDALGNTAKLWWFAPGELVLPEVDVSLDPLPFDADSMFHT